MADHTCDPDISEIELKDSTVARLYEQGWVKPVITWQFTRKGDREVARAYKRMPKRHGYDVPHEVYDAFKAVKAWRPKQLGNRIIQRLASLLLSRARIGAGPCADGKPDRPA